MKGDSTDEFPIVGDTGISNETNHDDSILEESVWTDEFEVGSSQELANDDSPRFLLSRIWTIFPRFRGPKRSSQHGVEVEEPHDVPDDSTGPIRPSGITRTGSRAGDHTRIIEVRAIDRRIHETEDTKIEVTAPLVRPLPRQADPFGASRGERRDFGRRPDSGSPDIDDSGADLDFAEPHLDKFSLEKDEFLIVQSSASSKRSAWLESLSLPIVLTRNILRRIGLGRERRGEEDFEVATKRTLRGYWIPGLRRARGTSPIEFGADERSLDSDSSTPESQIEPHDEFTISSDLTAKSAPLSVDSPVPTLPQHPEEGVEDYQVATGTERRRIDYRPDSDSSRESSGQPGDVNVAGLASSGISQASSLSGRLENLLDYTARDVNAVITEGSDSAGTPFEQDARQPQAQTPSIVRFLLSVAAWLLTIPKRSLTAEGDLSDQNRLKIEPLIAAMPAMMGLVTVIFSVSNFLARDRFDASNSYLKAAKSFDAAGRLETALVSAVRSCSESDTLNNRYEYAFLKTKSARPEDAMLGLRLMRSLASPAGGNQPDAHLFIANEILRRSSESQELRQRSFPFYLAELRAGFEASPQRYDLLEKLAEGLSDRGEDQTLTNLITPYLDFWPLGHFFLAQAAFSRGDDILQKTHAFAMVRHFRGNPADIDANENSRVRYVISLALAGEFAEATDMSSKFFGSESNRNLGEQLAERIKLIRLLSKMSEFPEGTDRDVEALGAELFAGELTPLYKSAVKRQLLRKGPLRPALVDLCRKLHAERRKSFDADDYVFWASILRQNQQNAEAREYLENATKIDPKNDVAANNLANLLYKLEPYDPERALSLTQGVLSRNPENPIYLETRGQILARLGRAQEAIDDLTRCLVPFPEVPEIHETLAGCYRKIGNDVLAKAHQDRFEELKARAKSTAAKPSP